jgi:hypothetical protein
VRGRRERVQIERRISVGRRGKMGKVLRVVAARGGWVGAVKSAMVRLMRLVLVPRHVDPGES